MNAVERSEMAQMRDCVQNLALQVAKLSQAVEPLVRLQDEQGRMRDRVGELEGFRAAILWLAGLTCTATIIRFAIQIWNGGK